MLIFPGLRLFLFFVFFVFFFCTANNSSTNPGDCVQLLSCPFPQQQHQQQLADKLIICHSAPSIVWQTRHKLNCTNCPPDIGEPVWNSHNAVPPRRVPPNRLFHDAFVTHSVCQDLKCDLCVRVCVETPIVWLHFSATSVYRQSLWTWIYIFLWFPNWAFLPVCSICLPHPTTNGLLLVGRLPVCCRDWPKLPAALWPWCQGWSRGWGGRPAPDWSHRYLVKEASCDISAALTKCKVMISILSWYQVEGRRCSWYRHRFHVKSL